MQTKFLKFWTPPTLPFKGQIFTHWSSLCMNSPQSTRTIRNLKQTQFLCKHVCVCLRVWTFKGRHRTVFPYPQEQTWHYSCSLACWLKPLSTSLLLACFTYLHISQATVCLLNHMQYYLFYEGKQTGIVLQNSKCILCTMSAFGIRGEKKRNILKNANTF